METTVVQRIDGEKPEMAGLKFSTSEDLAKLCRMIAEIGFSGLSEELNYDVSDLELISNIYEGLMQNIQEVLDRGLLRLEDVCNINSALSSVVALAATNEQSRILVKKAKLLEHIVPFMSILHDLVNPPKPRRPGLAAPNIEPDYMKQTYRAIGNCCFEFAENCKIIEGIPDAVKIMVKCSGRASGEFLSCVVGSLMNIVIQNEKLLDDLSKQDCYNLYIDAIDGLKLDTDVDANNTARGAVFALSILLSIQESSTIKYPTRLLLEKIYNVISKLNDRISFLSSENKYPTAIEIECLRAALNVADAPSQDEEHHLCAFELGAVDHVIKLSDNYKYITSSHDEGIRKHYMVCQTLAASVLNCIASCNEAMKSINVNGKLLDTIHSWIRTFLDSKVSEESDNKAATAGGGGPLHDSAKIAGSISALGTYCLGNLCRNDASSELVFKMPEIIDSIFEILNKGLEKSNILASRNPETRIGDHSSIVSDIAKSTPLSNPESVDLLKITHAVVGTLRNLSVHKAGAQLFLEKGLVQILCSVLADTRFLFMRHEVVGLMRFVCTQDLGASSGGGIENHNCPRLTPGSPIDAVMSRAADSYSDADIPFRNEAARLCTKIIKIVTVIGLRDAIKSLASDKNFVCTIIQAVTGIPSSSSVSLSGSCLELRPRNMNPELKPCQIYKNVQLECILSLAILAAGVIYQHLPVLVKSLSDILCRSGHDDQQDCPVEFKVNICVLLKTLADEFNILSSEVPQELVEYLKNSSSLNVPVQGDDACSTAAPHEQNRPIPPQNMLAIVSKALLNSLQQSHAAYEESKN